jgi:chromosome segregation ATPase
MSDIVADAKEWLAYFGGERMQTHSGSCHKWHSTCLVHKLTREIERLRTLAEQATPSEGSVQGEGTETLGQRLVERLSITQEMLDDNEKLRAEIKRLREVIRRLADQDATLSMQDGNVTVTMDATLTDEEREAIEQVLDEINGTHPAASWVPATLRKLLTRLAVK